MSSKRSRAMRAGVEGLERRETPSTHTSAAAATAIRGAGAAVVTLSKPVVNGQEVDGIFSGASKVLGNYTGTFSSFFGLHRSQGAGVGVITTASGDTINIAYRESIQPGGTPRHHAPGVVQMVVTGGTGAFANATGRGLATGKVDPALAAFKYTFHLRITT
jgi:hypothetical protein